jgi:hypothetical protein
MAHGVGEGRGGVQECGVPEGCAEERREMEFFVGINEPLVRIRGRLGGGVVI